MILWELDRSIRNWLKSFRISLMDMGLWIRLEVRIQAVICPFLARKLLKCLK